MLNPANILGVVNMRDMLHCVRTDIIEESKSGFMIGLHIDMLKECFVLLNGDAE